MPLFSVAIVSFLLSLALFASIPVAVFDDMRRRVAETTRERAVVNGRVKDLAEVEDHLMAVVQFSPQAGQIYTINVDAGGGGRFDFAAPSMKIGDSVVVQFNPENPLQARVFSFHVLWTSVVRRAVAGSASLLVAVAAFALARLRRRASLAAARAALPVQPAKPDP